eukprot:6461752-Prymnesium_polylepis.1
MLPVTRTSHAARRVAGTARKDEPDNPLRRRTNDDVCHRCPKPSQGCGLRAQCVRSLGYYTHDFGY